MSVGKKDDAKALLLLRERSVISPSVFVEIVIWRVPSPLRGSNHTFKYRLALVTNEVSFPFTTIEQLVDDFWRDVELWRKQQ